MFNAKQVPVLWAPQHATDPAAAIIQSLAPLLSPSGTSKIWHNWTEAEYILHLDGLPIPQYFSNLLRPFASSDSAIRELSLVGPERCGQCYGRVWVCNLDSRETAYEDISEGDERIGLLRHGLLRLTKGTTRFDSKARSHQGNPMTVGISAFELPRTSSPTAGYYRITRSRRNKPRPKFVRPRQIVNLLELIRAMEQKGISSQVVIFEKLSTASMLATMAKLNVFVAMHGPELINAVFLPPASAVIEIRPLGFDATYAFSWPRWFEKRLGYFHELMYFSICIYDQGMSVKGPLESVRGEYGEDGIFRPSKGAIRDRSVMLQPRYLLSVLDTILALKGNITLYNGAGSTKVCTDGWRSQSPVAADDRPNPPCGVSLFKNV
jgi:hypothetical protein